MSNRVNLGEREKKIGRNKKKCNQFECGKKELVTKNNSRRSMNTAESWE